MLEFGKRLKELRLSKNLKQSDMAAFLDITSRHYQDMEYGKINVPALTLIALANYFYVSLDYLTGRNDNPDSHTITLAWQKDFDKVMSDIVQSGAANPEFAKIIEKYFNK